MNTVTAEPETQSKPLQAPERPKPLSRAKQELASALEKFQGQRNEIESNEKRLAEAQKDEAALLAASMDEEEEQVVAKLSTVVAKQRLLESKVQAGRNRLEATETELRQAADDALRSFDDALADLVKSRTAKNAARLKELVDPDAWIWAESHALAFIRHVSDIKRLDMLGHETHVILQGRAVLKGAENLLMDIAKLEGEGRP